MRILAACLAVLIAAAADDPAAPSEKEDAYRDSRNRMVDEQIARWSMSRTRVEDKRVLDAMRTVPRHKFVPASLIPRAYADRPLPIGHGQTISQPYIVAYMTEMLKLDKDDVVLEIGTGSGYQAAVCAEIAKHVYTIEIVEPLGETAVKRLKDLKYGNVTCRIGDGYFGWKEHAPFDAIIVTAAASHIPPPLIEQLKPGGHMAIPVGPPLHTQYLMLLEKREDGSVRQKSVMPVRFVPFTRAKDKDEKSEKKED
ncbi:MAG: protein-L-isoaspartate(D-aspartate) O-methyltransferase [bacterium]|nr:protein-L-isoaspartate(D-aspartate) O-methyltransferase [bacterium]